MIKKSLQDRLEKLEHARRGDVRWELSWISPRKPANDSADDWAKTVETFKGNKNVSLIETEHYREIRWHALDLPESLSDQG